MQDLLNVELTVYLITALCALLLLPKSSNWRLRLLIGTVGLQALAHCASELRNHHAFWQSRLGQLSGVIELFGGALALTAIYLLKRENRDRHSTNFRLRLAEAVPAPELRAVSAEPLAAGLNSTPGNDSHGQEAAPPGDSLESSAMAPCKEPAKHSRLRRHRRYPLAGEVEITVLADPGAKSPGECVDSPKSGAGLPLLRAIHEGALVKVEFGDCLFLGRLRFYESGEREFCVGVQFEESCDFKRLVEIVKHSSTGNSTSQ